MGDLDAVVGQGEWASADEGLTAVEVTSNDSDTERRDRLDKPRAHAEAGIPVHLLIDRDSCEVRVHSRPQRDRGKYERVENVPCGESRTLPDPVGIDIDTVPLKVWGR
ncbi:Uma2 family endonuclease [Streptomyces sp. YIM 130001]|uniref:Uma2 family endonuclease n=1 Tax=Streptomyces sp. YIM 130001 TaxID=2259644 RepID=UPI001F08F126|nr:Uma2 family endonuclease [Streptomyces sp. YIM 130001]